MQVPTTVFCFIGRGYHHGDCILFLFFFELLIVDHWGRQFLSWLESNLGARIGSLA